jgi:hypothetical protein
VSLKKYIFIIFILISTSFFSQNKNVEIGMPEIQILFVGYDNILNHSFIDKIHKKIRLECEGCDTIHKIQNEKNLWVIRVDKIKPVKIIARKKNGKILKEIDLKVVSTPPPLVYVNNVAVNNKITSQPDKIALKHHESTPIIASFTILSWKIIIDNIEFIGSRNIISENVKTLINQKKKCKAIIEIKYLTFYGTEKINEVIEFDLE